MLLLGVVAVLAVAVGIVVALRLARKQNAEEAAPISKPSDFVAPISGGYAWRNVDESQEQFRQRVARENGPKR